MNMPLLFNDGCEEPTVEDRLDEVRVRRTHPVFYLYDVRDVLKDTSRDEVHLERLRVTLQDCLAKLEEAGVREAELEHKLTHLTKKATALEEERDGLNHKLKQATWSVDRLSRSIEQAHANSGTLLAAAKTEQAQFGTKKEVKE